MANHDILLTSANWSADLGQAPMDDESFRKMAEEVKRPRSTGVSVFRNTHSTAHPPATVEAEQTSGALNLSPPNPDRVWESLNPVALNAATLAGNGLFANAQQSPEIAHFDILRTRLLHAMQERGWTRIAITSPTHGCGKSFVAANLALSLARRPSSRTVLLDLELRQPALANLFGLTDIGPIREFLNGEQPLESHFRRVGRTLALGLNGTPVSAAAEVLHEPSTTDTLDAMVAQLHPDLIVIDAPPVLVSDDVLALLPKVDAVLLIVDGTKTTAEEVRACERLFEGNCPLMGVVLNRAQDRGLRRYRYGHK
ncbi:exopolysaccharide biosynthesis protein [Pseudorhodobacter sp. E13]|uniref:CpsD/CapB family tyrosine-protein kinase n=1 Tax=Pseudorhodobacter sp. E13 TaxID=2487931 RepID=UPI000F8F6329|nr:CpsD/CapB family tyrosine-protein kinase [Pseudorhodobacter sp. E13]RUS60142.1 exopolysaccharide biosynthesis protein [Pseudorhodobacter sp. E13]